MLSIWIRIAGEWVCQIVQSRPFTSSSLLRCKKLTASNLPKWIHLLSKLIRSDLQLRTRKSDKVFSINSFWCSSSSNMPLNFRLSKLRPCYQLKRVSAQNSLNRYLSSFQLTSSHMWPPMSWVTRRASARLQWEKYTKVQLNRNTIQEKAQLRGFWIQFQKKTQDLIVQFRNQTFKVKITAARRVVQDRL